MEHNLFRPTVEFSTKEDFLEKLKGLSGNITIYDVHISSLCLSYISDLISINDFGDATRGCNFLIELRELVDYLKSIDYIVDYINIEKNMFRIRAVK